MKDWMKHGAIGAATLLLVAGCALETTSAQSRGSASPRTTTSEREAQPQATAQIDPAQAARLKNVMLPLIKAMDHPIPLNEVKVGLMKDSHINAANAGGGEFYARLVAHPSRRARYAAVSAPALVRNARRSPDNACRGTSSSLASADRE